MSRLKVTYRAWRVVREGHSAAAVHRETSRRLAAYTPAVWKPGSSKSAANQSVPGIKRRGDGVLAERGLGGAVAAGGSAPMSRSASRGMRVTGTGPHGTADIIREDEWGLGT